MRRWLKILDPLRFGLPEWVTTMRPLSHLAPYACTYCLDWASPPPMPEPVCTLHEKERFFQILADCRMEPFSINVSGVTIGDPFKVVEREGHPELASPRGAVVIGEGCEFGHYTVVDRGIYGEFTEIGNDVKVDNLVHIGHSAIIGDRSILVAHTTVGGFAEIGADCFVGMGVQILPHVKVGAGSKIGAGSVVNRDIPPKSLAYGSPVRVKAGMCCGKKVVFEGSIGKCPLCGHDFGLSEGKVHAL